MRYEYQFVYADANKLNALGALGWRVLPTSWRSDGYVLMERALRPEKQA